MTAQACNISNLAESSSTLFWPGEITLCLSPTPRLQKGAPPGPFPGCKREERLHQGKCPYPTPEDALCPRWARQLNLAGWHPCLPQSQEERASVSAEGMSGCEFPSWSAASAARRARKKQQKVRAGAMERRASLPGPGDTAESCPAEGQWGRRKTCPGVSEDHQPRIDA